MNFRIGQKVVYIGGSPESAREKREHPYPGDSPIIGGIYTVAKIFTTPKGVVNIELVEIYSPEDDHWYSGFDASCFRPLVTRKTSIEIFERMLRPVPEKVRA